MAHLFVITEVLFGPLIEYHLQLLGRVDFSNLFLNLSSTHAATLSEARDAGLPVIAYGSFLNAVVDFLIVAFAIFLLIKQVNRLMPKKEAKAARLCPYCRQEIADDATRCPHCTSELPAAAKE